MAAQPSRNFTPSKLGERVRRIALVALALSLFWSCDDASAQDVRTREYPPSEYYLAMNIFHDGDFNSSARAFRAAARLGMRSTEGRWVDSICYHTMLGESMYQMGELGQAADEFTAALNLFLAHRSWLLRVELPGLEPAQPGSRRPITWGVSARRTIPARFPDRYQILQGRLDNQVVLQQGGVVALPEVYLINAHEIMRCTALAIRRRHEIMGRAAAHDPLTAQLIQALSVRPAPPNHWSGAWIDCLMGLAYASSGRAPEALGELNKSLVLGSQFDHPLTATGLFAVGKLAFEQEQYGNASQFFLEASLSAAWFGQSALVEEALRWGALTHIVSGQTGMYPPLAPASVWARRQSNLLETSLVVAAAEVAATANETPAAVTLLDQARRSMARAEMRAGHVGARYQYVLALTNYAAGNVTAGDAALSTLMTYQRKSSQRMFELSLIDRLVTSGTVSERVASDLYSHALREPQPKDWGVEPVETLTYVLTPHPLPLEHWLAIALQRKEEEQAIEITDRIRRHRFYTTLPMGGRLLALRWVLEAPREALSERALLQRQDLHARYPKYAQLARQAGELREKLTEIPLVPADDAARRKQVDLMSQLSKVSVAQEVTLREVALRRVAADFAFPPELRWKEYQSRLPARTLVISYLSTDQGIHVFMLSKDSYSHGNFAGGAKLHKSVGDFLKLLGHFDRNQPVDVETLAKDDWKEPARLLLAALTNDSKAIDWNEIDELVLIPDGPLWYVPFEALQVGEPGSTKSLISQTRIRYAPTIALSQPDGRPSRSDVETAVVVGSLFPRDDVKIGQAALEELSAVLPRVTKLNDPLSIPSNLLASFCKRLVVLTDVQQDSPNLYDWSPMQIDRGKPGGTLGDWTRLPWGSPDQVIVPGFHTEAEAALKKAANGQDMFLAICGLMASGTRTILISRWRTAGKSSYDLMREFVQELPHTSAPLAWQRSVFLSLQNELLVGREPRVKANNLDAVIKTDHPFFWSGYLLVAPGALPNEGGAAVKNAVAEAKDAAK